jgi:hypothetical protein
VFVQFSLEKRKKEKEKRIVYLAWWDRDGEDKL